MEIGSILNKLKRAVSGSVLESAPFGRSQTTSIWIESRTLPGVAQFLKSDPEIHFDWLENLSAIQMDKSIVLTFFLRSTEFVSQTLILRASVDPLGASKEVDFPSVLKQWRMAAPFEAEIQELFGVRFRDENGQSVYPESFRLPAGWNGYPLRKTYVFPTEFLGIAHARRPTAPEGNA